MANLSSDSSGEAAGVNGARARAANTPKSTICQRFSAADASNTGIV